MSSIAKVVTRAIEVGMPWRDPGIRHCKLGESGEHRQLKEKANGRHAEVLSRHEYTSMLLSLSLFRNLLRFLNGKTRIEKLAGANRAAPVRSASF